MGHELDSFVQSINATLDQAPDVRSRTLAVRDLVVRALHSREFHLACIERLLDKIALGDGVRLFTSLHFDRDRLYSVRMVFWRGGLVANPHRHDHWTVTGVMHNTLRFCVFELDACGALVPRPIKQLDAAAGEVGYICTPCIHNVANLGEATAVSLHVFSHPRAGEAADTAVFALPGGAPIAAAEDLVASAAVRDRALCDCTPLLGALGGDRARVALARIFQAGSHRTKLHAVRALLALDPATGAAKARELADSLPEPQAVRLRSLCHAMQSPLSV